MRRLAALAVVLAFLGTGVPASAYHDGEMPVVLVYQPGGMDPSNAAAVEQVAAAQGAMWAPVHTGTLGLLRVLRGEEVVQEAPPGFRYPMAATALDPAAAASILGPEVSGVLRSGRLVMGEVSAGLRGAGPDDQVELLGWDGGVHRLEIGAVVPDRVIGWDELALSTETAASLGFVRHSSTVIWGGDPSRLRQALAERLEGQPVGIRTSEDPPDPDRVLPTALLKRRFGEFAYRPTGGDGVEIEAAWVQANIVWMELPMLGRFRCHRLMGLYLERVVADLVESGFIYQVDPSDFQRSGGCWNPRMIRGGDKGGALSRHAWGAAIDINPSRNPYGGSVAMSSAIVERFRRWGFAWGGTWVSTDGGHFEWSHYPEFMMGKTSAFSPQLSAGLP